MTELAEDIAYSRDRIRSINREDGSVEIGIAFDRVLIYMNEVDVKAFVESVEEIDRRRRDEKNAKKFILAPSSVTRQKGSQWKTICWTESDEAYGLRHGGIYWEVSKREMEEVMPFMRDAGGMRILH